MLGCSLQRHVVEAHQVLTIENEFLSISIDIEHGAHIFEFLDKQTGIDFMYKDPRGIANYDVGGWYELFPNAGQRCRYQEIDVPQHGDVQHLPWKYRIVKETAAEIVVRLNTDSGIIPVSLERTLILQQGQPCLFIQENVTNLSDKIQPYLWGHHVTFGEPFIGSRCRIDVPQCRIYKRTDYGQDSSRLAEDASGQFEAMPGKQGEKVNLSYFPVNPSSEMLFVDEMKEHWYNVFNEDLQVGFALAWDPETFPYLWLWQEHHASMSEPFRGKVTCMALEPQSSNVPILTNAVREGQAPFLSGKQTVQAWLTAVVHHDSNKVRSVTRAGQLTIKKCEGT